MGVVLENVIEEINRPFIQQSLIFREEQSVKDKISGNTKKRST